MSAQALWLGLGICDVELEMKPVLWKGRQRNELEIIDHCDKLYDKIRHTINSRKSFGRIVLNCTVYYFAFSIWLKHFYSLLLKVIYKAYTTQSFYLLQSLFFWGNYSQGILWKIAIGIHSTFSSPLMLTLLK